MNATEEDVNAFLAHYGVRGQKWGVRKKQEVRVGTALGRLAAKGRAPAGDWKRSSGKRKLALTGAGIGSYVVGQAVVNGLLRGHLVGHPIAAVSVGTVSSIAGIRITRNLLNKHKDKKMAELAKYN